MGCNRLLDLIVPHKPIFNIRQAVLSAPVRHVFMNAVVWYMSKEGRVSPIRILEIGSWFGASTLTWAGAVDRYFSCKSSLACLDAWKPYFDMQKHHDADYARVMEMYLKDDLAYQIFLHNIKFIPRTVDCVHFRGYSDRILPQLKNDYFDLVYIDGDHTARQVSSDLHNALPLVSEGGILCGDDLNLQLHQIDPEHARKHADQDLCVDPASGRNYHPGVTLAVGEILGPVSMWGGFWAMQRSAGSWTPLSLDGMPVVYPDHLPESAVSDAKRHLEDIQIR